MPEKKTIERALKDKQQGKSASTQAGEFVREEMSMSEKANTVRAQRNKRSRSV